MAVQTKKQLAAGLLADLKKSQVKVLDASTLKPISVSKLRAITKRGSASWGFSAWLKI